MSSVSFSIAEGGIIDRPMSCNRPMSWIDGDETIQCGICLRDGGEQYYITEKSRYAHYTCAFKIAQAENGLNRFINRAFANQPYYYHAVAHASAVKAVTQAVQEKNKEYTLLTFAEQQGLEKLTDLFNSVGIPAAEKAAKEIKAAEMVERFPQARL